MIVSTGYKLFPADLKPQYGYGRFQNVITGMQMERLLAPTRPYNTVLRPGDGRVPERVAYVMCTGSRDETVGNPLCSKFCCMYSIKQNQLIMGALPLADVTVHYIDIRAVGKGYDEFFEQSKAMGATFVKGRISEITETDEGNLDASLRGHRERRRCRRGRVRPGRARGRRAAEPRRRPPLHGRGARARRRRLRRRDRGGHQPRPHEHPRRVRRGSRVGRQGHPRVDPARRSRRCAGGGPPRARTRVLRHDANGGSASTSATAAGTSRTTSTSSRSSTAVKDEPGVVVARRAMFTCSDSTQQEIIDDIQGQELDGLVVASCSPKLHTFTFRAVAQRAGLNPYEYTQVNVREQCSWTHTDDREGATPQGDLARARRHRPHPPDEAARADRRRDDAARARDRRRDRRHARGGRPRRRRARGLPRRARGGARRLGRRLRRALPARQGRTAR